MGMEEGEMLRGRVRVCVGLLEGRGCILGVICVRQDGRFQGKDYVRIQSTRCWYVKYM